jgi:hypothetical protein
MVLLEDRKRRSVHLGKASLTLGLEFGEGIVEGNRHAAGEDDNGKPDKHIEAGGDGKAAHRVSSPSRTLGM